MATSKDLGAAQAQIQDSKLHWDVKALMFHRPVPDGQSSHGGETSQGLTNKDARVVEPSNAENSRVKQLARMTMVVT